MTITQEETPFDSQVGYGSLERGLNGQFDFSIRAVIKECWARISGNKGTIWLAILIFLVVYGGVSIVISMLLKLVGLATPEVPSVSAAFILPSIISNILIGFATVPLSAGFWMLGLKLVTGQPAEATIVVGYYKKIVPLFLTYLAMYALIILGFCLLIIPGIYLSVAYFMALPLVVEKYLGVWQALEPSSKAVNHIWFKLFAFFILVTIALVFAIIPLGIGLIWLVPMLILSYGVIYRSIFGVETSVAVSA